MFKKIMIGLGIFFAIVIIIVGIALYATGNVTDVVQQQLAALRAGDTIKAYSYTSHDFKNATSLSDFKRFVEEYPALKDNSSATFPHREITNDQGLVKGTLHGKENGSTPIEYRLIKENDEWKIFSMKVDASGISRKTEIKGSPKVEPPASPLPLTKVFDNKESRYTIKYPWSWEIDRSSEGTVIFSGKAGTPSFYSTVNIQVVLTKSNGGQYSTIKQFMNDLRNQTSKEFKNTKFLDQGPITISGPNGVKATGEFITFTSTYKGQSFKQWQVVVLREDNRVFYAWAYTSPVDQYDSDLEVAKAMLESWAVY